MQDVMKRRCVRQFLAAALLLTLPPGLAAQEIGGEANAAADETPVPPRFEPSTMISGFRGIEFGASADDIRATFGEPLEERLLENGLRMLAYRGELAGQPSVILFGLLDDRGFVKAQEVIDLAGGEECVGQIRDIHHEINLKYPLIRPAEQARNNTPDAICTAAPAGQAYWHRQWSDDSTGALITVSVPSGGDEVDVVYESRAFRDWVSPDAGERADVIEDEGPPEEALSPVD